MNAWPAWVRIRIKEMRVGDRATMPSQFNDAGGYVVPSKVIDVVRRYKGSKMQPMEFGASKNERGLVVATRIK